MDTDLQPIAEQPRLTRKVNAIAGVCISAYLYCNSRSCSQAAMNFDHELQGLHRFFISVPSAIRG